VKRKYTFYNTKLKEKQPRFNFAKGLRALSWIKNSETKVYMEVKFVVIPCCRFYTEKIESLVLCVSHFDNSPDAVKPVT
jgi:hypothetical protein